MNQSEIRPLTDDELLPAVIIAANAYPGGNIRTQSDIERSLERTRRMHNDPDITLFGLFRENDLQGVMRLYDFQMRLHDAEFLVGGIGGVAVDLFHKKERIAFDMLRYYLRHYRDKGAPLAALYPFRPDFYKKMGFGFGAQSNTYRLQTATLPKGGNKEKVRFLSQLDRVALVGCYEAYRHQTSGLMHKTDFELDTLFERSDLKTVGYFDNGRLQAYAIFRFVKGTHNNFLSNDLEILEFAYLNPDALMGLLTFFQTQADQCEITIINSMLDGLYYLSNDPRSDARQLIPGIFHKSNRQGVGIMYRVIDLPRLFFNLREVNFGNQSCTLRLILHDSFLPENDGDYTLHFDQGKATLLANSDKTAVPDATLALDVAEFSSLITSAVAPKILHDFGRFTLDPPSFLPTLTALFSPFQKPLCFSRF